MRFTFFLAMLLNYRVSISASEETHSSDIYICGAGDTAFLGKFTASREEHDGVPVFSSQNDMSFFRNNGFWYLGNLSEWPPQTHYRCVEIEGCNHGLSVPPTTAEGIWSVSKLHGKEPIPFISSEECDSIINLHITSKEEL